MLFSALVLVSVNREHDSLEKRVDFGHGDQSAEVRDMSWLGLQEKQEVAIFLSLVIVGEEAFLHLGGVLQMAGNFILLLSLEPFPTPVKSLLTSSNAMRF